MTLSVTPPVQFDSNRYDWIQRYVKSGQINTSPDAARKMHSMALTRVVV